MVTATCQIAEDDRTTAIGLFNYANSYWKSASELQNLKIPNITHPSAPVDFLYVHAIELFLKSYLRLNRSVQELKSIGHKLEDLKNCSGDLFTDADGEHAQSLEVIAQHKINSFSRYISTGYRENYPTTERFEKLCAFLCDAIKPKMMAAGFPVR